MPRRAHRSFRARPQLGLPRCVGVCDGEELRDSLRELQRLDLLREEPALAAAGFRLSTR
jgi:hypothetical protein